MSSGALLLALALAAPSTAQAPDETPPIQRYLADLYLGDTLDEIRQVYPPSQEWPSSVQPRGQVTRYRAERAFLKSPPPRVDTLWLGLRKSRLVEIQLVYTAEYTRAKSVEALAGDLSLIYGEPSRSRGRFWWTDGKTVLRVFYAEVPVLDGAGQGVELRTSIQLLEESLFRRD